MQNEIKFEKNKVQEFINFVSKDAEDISIYISADETYAKVNFCFVEEELKIKSGEVLLRTNEPIPRTIPQLYKYKVK